jgi:hypothetical protein
MSAQKVLQTLSLEQIEKLKSRYYNLLNELTVKYQVVKDIEDQKEYAFAIQFEPLKAVLFEMKKGLNAEKALMKSTFRKILEYLNAR